MEAPKETRRSEQKERQTIQKTNLENRQPVTEGLLSRPKTIKSKTAQSGLPAIDSAVASRFKMNRPAVAPRASIERHSVASQPKIVSEFIAPQKRSTTPSTQSISRAQSPIAARRNQLGRSESERALSTPNSIAEVVTRMAVAIPATSAPQAPLEAQTASQKQTPTPVPTPAPLNPVNQNPDNGFMSPDGFADIIEPRAKKGFLSRFRRDKTAENDFVETQHLDALTVDQDVIEPENINQPSNIETPITQNNQLDYHQSLTTPTQELPPAPEPDQAVPAAPAMPSDQSSTQPLPRRRLPGIDMELPGDESPDRGIGALLKNSRKLTFKRWALRGGIAVVAVFLVGGGLFLAQINKAFKGGAGTATAMKKNVDPNLLKGEGSGRINVLLMGRGGGAHDAPDLTDTMMLASIDPINKKTTLISVPRDLWINIPSAGNMKINAAYETGVSKYTGKKLSNVTDKKAINAGFNMVDQAVEDVLGVNVNYNVLVDFKAFSKAVNTVGGINVTVPEDLIDPTMAWENHNDPVIAKAGPQVMDGKKALNYVRSRQTSNDFMRSMRQRIALLGLKSKIDDSGTLSNPAKISQLASAFGNNVQTDLSLKDAGRLLNITRKITETNTTSIGLADPPNQFVATGNMTGQSIVLPKAGLFKYSEIQAFIRSQLKDPYILKERAKILVLNGTTTAGLATAKSEELKAYGYNVIKAGETPDSGWTQTMLVDLSKGKNKYTAKYLEKRLGVVKYKSLPDQAIQANGADFVIILGSDKAPN